MTQPRLRNRKRTWMPFNTGVIALSGSNVVRVGIPSIAEIHLGREIQGYTTQRLIFNMTMRSDTTTPMQFTMGVINLNQNVVISSLDPGADPMSDWQYWEMLRANESTKDFTWIHRDLNISRRSRGRDQDLFFYISNELSVAGSFHLAGRVLILED